MPQSAINVLITVISVVVMLVVKSLYDAKTQKRKLRGRVMRRWGEVPEEEYTQEKYDSIQFFYRVKAKRERDVDDITWNDLAMDQVYMLMNNTCSAIGEEYLYAVLRRPVTDEKVLAERNRLMEFFAENEEKRLDLQVELACMGKMKRISVYEYMNRLNAIPEESNVPHVMMAICMATGLGMCLFSPGIGVMVSLVVAIYNVVMYNKRKRVIEPYFEVVSYIIRLLEAVKGIPKLEIPEIAEYSETLLKAGKTFQGFRRGASVVAPKKATGDMMDVFVDYLRVLFHVDLIKFNRMLAQLKNNEKELNRIYETIGILDSMLAAASFREMTKDWCLPELVHEKKPFLEAENVYHPMLEEPVKNSLRENRCVLITGSNASGKSTFIKTLAINAILAQTIFTALADRYRSCYFKVASSMALKDDIENHESYYIVEIKSLKRILDGLREELPTLCFVDEVLRGTNTLERIAASSQILDGFSKAGAMCFAATHDIELTHILEKEYSNYHFQEQVTEDSILFDYKLYEGRAVSRNAIKLLGMMGYSEQIISRANEAASHFLEAGEWNAVE
ncbi:MAG: hypothetical protein J6B85_13915 [Lachnospiraceae bacterium]|nr:hypothetical protein [Lachnospiraceae bacterium]